MSDIVFGSSEHIAGLSRKALEEDFRWVHSRMMEMEGICERLEAENAKLRELTRYMYRCFVRGHDWGPYCAGETEYVENRMYELGIEVDE